MFDLILRNANLPDGRQGFDIGVAAGRNRRHRESTTTQQAAKRSMQPAGSSARRSATPHFHMDAHCRGMPRLNVSGTLLEGIALWANCGRC